MHVTRYAGLMPHGGLATVVMSLLVPQVKLSKRLDVARAAERWSAQVPALIEQQLRAE